MRRRSARLACSLVFLLGGCATGDSSGVPSVGTSGDADATFDETLVDSGVVETSVDTGVDSGALDTAPDVEEADVPVEVGPPCTVDDDCIVVADACTNAAICSAGHCKTIGGPKNCDDKIDCTADSCDPPSGKCKHDAKDSVCTGGQLCDPKLGCVEKLPCAGAGDTVCDRLNDDACKGSFACDLASFTCK